MLQRTLDLHYDKLVIGADLSALRFCYVNNVPYIGKYNKIQEYDFDGYKIKFQEYYKLAQLTSLRSLNAFSGLCEAVRIENDKTLKVATPQGLSVTVHFENLIISDSTILEGMPSPSDATGNDNLVLDYIDVSSGLYHEFDFIETEDEFVKKIYFYPSKRFFYRNLDNKKDCVSLSIVKTKDLEEFDYSEVASRLKTKKEMEKVGIKGRWDKTNQHFKKVKLNSRVREVYPLYKNIYNDLPSNIQLLHSHENIVLEDKLYE